MLFKLSNTLFATTLALVVMVGGVSAAVPERRAAALADNPVDACNGDNQYGVGHDCAWSGGNEGTCQTNSCGVLVCVN
ncbi:unnamed protein product [Peniophora sp. CBMAI 1063]|nr:unnamed protein product [Peniophora sp. CBMAI 1063]